jgi:hypothetical protein
MASISFKSKPLKINIKKNLLRLISPLLLCFIACFSQAQPQWKFHLAFEDATGARDTIWFIWDTTAHFILPVDEHLGEGRTEMNLNEFNVFVRNHEGDSTKTFSLPYGIPDLTNSIYAINYQYPITLRWDSSMFNAPFLPEPG